MRLQPPKQKNIHTRVICYLKLNQLPLYHIPTQKSTQPRLEVPGYQIFTKQISHWVDPTAKKTENNNKQTRSQAAHDDGEGNLVPEKKGSFFLTLELPNK